MNNRLRVLRAERAWSQAEVAERLGVSRQTVNAVERGKYDPSLPLAFKIARLFHQPIEAIFRPEGEETRLPGSTEDAEQEQDSMSSDGHTGDGEKADR